MEVSVGETVGAIVSRFDPDLSSKTVAALVDGVEVDLSFAVTKSVHIEPITLDSDNGLEIIRHDAAHIMAQAIQELYPEAKLGIGPVIKDGFYYDVSSGRSFSESDLENIEKKISEIVRKDYPIIREEWERDDAIVFFQENGEKYKVELIHKIPIGEKISVYKQDGFVDLCRGPHAPSTGWLKHFKLLKVSGAYWLGDAKNDSMQRIYGTAWATKEELDNYLTFLEEAKKRDHRLIGKNMELFHLQEEAQGQVFWHESGLILYRILEDYIRGKLKAYGYHEIKTPIVFSKCLWEKSGHWAKFKENMFVIDSVDGEFSLKPMNCPAHIEVFKQSIKSYRDLPLRLAEFGMCHRNEASGALHGLMRVRGFVQDDAHIFCTPEQICPETVAFCALLKEIYTQLGFSKTEIRFSDRPEVRLGDDTTWDKAENALKSAMEEAGLEYGINPGEGAFYGPKIEFVLTDALNRKWQCGTLQVDFILPGRLGATYVDAEGRKQHPVMLHRAVLGTFERFIGILIEHYNGKFPLWLAPVQVCVLTITEKVQDHAAKIVELLLGKNIRTTFDFSNQRIDYKIRHHTTRRVPILWIIGKIEAQSNAVSVRRLGSLRSENKSVDDALYEVLDELNLK
ncbi:threonine--tRNA ligase [Neorickettsia helminthoeca str. Oregon]|uniref:Threonine--tRNA ligase n=1 Tax=Neorickettsia helminthoeca str. Oregon TaxID=1286528 RepID=X5H3U5_9RICK|nr:threonine--tRNA ligase [Neorickettsia helminthoeca str. Oregon]